MVLVGSGFSSVSLSESREVGVASAVVLIEVARLDSVE